MSWAELISKLLKLDPRLAAKALKNDRLIAKMKTDALMKELSLRSIDDPPIQSPSKNS